MLKLSINKVFLIFVGLGFIFALSSCATIFGSKMNTIKVNIGSPDSALVYLDGEFIGEAPFKIRIPKRTIQEGSLIEVKKDGYETMQYEVIRRPHAGYVILDILGGVVPMVVDVANGNIYRPNTNNIEYELVPLKKEAHSSKDKPEQVKK